MHQQILVGDVRAGLRQIPPASIHCVVTSPPYYGQRSYGTPPQIWSGDPECDHQWEAHRWYREGGGQAGSSREAYSTPGPKNAARLKAARWREDAECPRCLAWRGELGAEPTVELYVEHLVEVLDLVRQVLRPDGTLWLNLGDSYIDKQLQGAPWRVALEAQAGGWWLRQAVIWHKPNSSQDPAPDRPGTDYEHVFLLSPSDRYAYDAAAVAEPAAQPGELRQLRAVWRISALPHAAAHFATMPPDLAERCILAGCPPGGTVLDPFCGAGTTLLEADRHGRAGIGIELSDTYAALAAKRLRDDAPLLADVAVTVLEATDQSVPTH